MSTSQYRPEIDGLRAIAILLVVLFHASFSRGEYLLFAGGYIGVDVFFVISGYLITRILLSDMQRSNFSFVKFYERRARRILPALLTVTACTSVAAWYLLMPDGLLEYGRSLVATALFVANIFFLKLDNYTAELIAHRPLLHMWSLGIEEQFYIFFPPLLLVFFRYCRKYLTLMFTLIFLCSLLFSEYASLHHPGANFYLAPSRAWELLGGGILAWFEINDRRLVSPKFSAILSLLSMVTILGFAVIADESLRHPSLYTLPPVLATMILILTLDCKSITRTVLTARPMVWTGLISYSLYLWHQPVFAFTRIRLERPLLSSEKFFLLIVCFLLGMLSYYLVERPTRNRRVTSNRTIWSIALGGSLCIAIFGMSIHLGEGFPTRYNAAKILADSRQNRYAPDQGSRKCKNFVVEEGYCQFKGPASDGYTLITLGDSHIRTLDAPIVHNLSKLDFVENFIPLNSGTSFFSLDLDILMEQSQKKTPLNLVEYNSSRYAVIQQFTQQIVVTGGRLPLYLENTRFENLEGGIELGDRCWFISGETDNLTPLTFEEVLTSYQQTISELLQSGMKVVLIYPIPEVGWDVPKEMASRASEKNIETTLKKYPLHTSYQVFRARSARAYQLYDAIPDHPDLLRIYPEHILCQADRCLTHDSTSLYYRDDNHLSFYGASLLLEHMHERMLTKWTELLR